MHIVVTGLSHKTAPVEVREALAFPEHEVGEVLSNMISKPHISEGVLVSTCNRTEVYGVVTDLDHGRSDIASFLDSESRRRTGDGVDDYLYHYDAGNAVNHLFRVAASLDSMVVGEAQILGQIKEAYSMAFEAQTTNVVSNRLFRHAFTVGKRVRSETGIGENAVSISYAAVQLAGKVFSDLAGRAVMILGAGKMSELTAKHLISSGVKSTVIVNRSQARATEMARIFDGRPVAFEDRLDEMAKVDIIISSTGSQRPLVTKEDMRKVMAKRRHRPIFVIDIAVPRDFEPDVNDLDSVFLYDIDDLQSVVESNVAERTREAKQADKIISQEAGTFFSWLSSLEAVPTIAELRQKVDSLRQQEIEKALAKLEHLSEKDKNTVNALAYGLMNKILHEPTIRMKESSRSKGGYLYIESLRHLFALDESETDPDETQPSAARSQKRLKPVNE